MTGYVLSPRARSDIGEIWDYSVERWGAEQAELYLRQLKAAMELIGTKPDRGRTCDEIRQGYRKFSVGSHVLFYRVTDAGSDIVRILHRRMDFTSRL